MRSESQISILVVEDEEDIRNALLQLLELEGYVVSGAANGRQALERLETKSLPNLIILDLMMPVMNGWDFLGAVQADPRLGRIPILVISAAGEAAKQLQAQKTAVKAFIKKPIDLDCLLRQVQIRVTDVPEPVATE